MTMNSSRQHERLLQIIIIFSLVIRDPEQSREGADKAGVSEAGCSWLALPVSGCYH